MVEKLKDGDVVAAVDVVKIVAALVPTTSTAAATSEDKEEDENEYEDENEDEDEKYRSIIIDLFELQLELLSTKSIRIMYILLNFTFVNNDFF